MFDRYRLAYGYGNTREEAVGDAVSKGFRAAATTGKHPRKCKNSPAPLTMVGEWGGAFFSGLWD
ncbi:hypothetical protein PG2048B_1101 [Bifidobacterium pseudolongum subsp. globosum]|nr:hypothetical protein PG2048B_1101 [Bifidobacterium pseudolongum subsp. globosum]